MRELGEQLIESQSLCWVWILLLSDGSKLGFTDHDNTLNFIEISCQPQSGFTQGEIDTNLDFSANNGAVQGVLNSDFISPVDIRNGRFEGAQIETYRVDWNKTSNYAHISTGYIGEIRQKGAVFEAEWLGLSTQLERSTGRVFGRVCDAEFGDTRCGLNVANYPEGTLCPRTFSACRDQFSNTINFRGFPYLIGDDALIAGPKEGEPRDGGSRYS